MQYPDASEFNPYYKSYIEKFAESNILEALAKQEKNILNIGQIFSDKGDYRYAPEKWSVKEVLIHIADTERVMAYRALRIARGDQTPLAGFDQDLFIENVNVDNRSLHSIILEMNDVRKSTLSLLQPISEEESKLKGTASEAIVSVRALAFIIAGHCQHHLDVLNQKYL